VFSQKLAVTVKPEYDVIFSLKNALLNLFFCSFQFFFANLPWEKWVKLFFCLQHKITKFFAFPKFYNAFFDLDF
jgi:hypothetical protein